MLKVKIDSGQYFVGIICLFFLLISLFLIVAALIEFNPAILLGATAMFIGLSILLTMLLKAYFKSVKYFTNEGLVRNDGKQFSWKDVNRVIFNIKSFVSQKYAKLPWYGGGYLFRVEIQFKDDSSAWLMPARIANFDELYPFVLKLPGEHIDKKSRW